MLNCLYGVFSRELEVSIVKTVGHFLLQNLRYISHLYISMTIEFSYISHVYVLMTIAVLAAGRIRSQLSIRGLKATFLMVMNYDEKRLHVVGLTFLGSDMVVDAPDRVWVRGLTGIGLSISWIDISRAALACALKKIFYKARLEEGVKVWHKNCS